VRRLKIICLAVVFCLSFMLIAETQPAQIKPASSQPPKTLEERVAALEQDVDLVERLIVEFSEQLAFAIQKLRAIENKLQ